MDRSGIEAAEKNRKPSSEGPCSLAPEVTKTFVEAEVLSASTQYAVLGAEQDATDMELRQCFLRKAVEVHPSGRIHDAGERSLETDAFCKVAAAWTELRDMGSRWRYDMELQAGRGDVSTGKHLAPPMDLEKACGVFAFETWVCEKSACQVAQDFAPVLRHAKELVDEQGDANLRVLPDCQVTPTTVACGMAVSAGLLAAGCVATAAGYPQLGSCVRKGALFQGASQAASACQSSDFQAACANVSQKASRLGSACTSDPLSALFGGDSCIPYQRSRTCFYKEEDGSDSEDIVDSDDEDVRVILPGDTVRLVNVEGLSGRFGEVLKAPAFAGGSFQIRLLAPPIRHGAASSKSSERSISVKKASIQLANDFALQGCSSNTPASASHFI
mmetsp:Transcript_18247/g.42718  ORF Transcript_18247/g.42718 Transcript_18247/m.42718 type:complete len:387 (-) Transcript_18247:149-1309(-)